MPYKMYTNMKKSVLTKHEKSKEFDKMVKLMKNKLNIQNSIIGETGRNKKLMTKIFVKKLEKKKEDKNVKKLQISHTKSKSRYKEGTLNLSKNFMKNLNKNK